MTKSSSINPGLPSPDAPRRLRPVEAEPDPVAHHPSEGSQAEGCGPTTDLACVRTVDPQFAYKHLQQILETWAKRLPPEEVQLVQPGHLQPPTPGGSRRAVPRLLNPRR